MMLLDLGADMYWMDDFGNLPISGASELTSFAAIFEAGFEFDPPCVSRPRPIVLTRPSISVWRYIFQHKQAQSVGGVRALMVLCGIIMSNDPEIIDFLFARYAEELFQLKNLDPRYQTFLRDLAEERISYLLNYWLGSLFHVWFDRDDNFMMPLFTYKLFVMLERVCMPLVLSDSSEEFFSSMIPSIYMDGILDIMKACSWSMEIANAIVRIWSQPFIELEMIFFSHHPCTTRGNREDSDGENSDGEESDKESTAYPAKKRLWVDCCREIYCEIIHENQRDNFSLKITSSARSEYSHLDPQFLCEAGQIRCDQTGAGRCLSRIDEAFIKDGKFSMNIPGQWEEPLLPNSAMELTLHRPDVWSCHTCYSIIQGPEPDHYKSFTTEGIQQIEEDLRNGTLCALSEDCLKRPGESDRREVRTCDVYVDFDMNVDDNDNSNFDSPLKAKPPPPHQLTQNAGNPTLGPHDPFQNK
ncbi:hypothetical protein EAE96_007760 [Botrytis aclada]|nr:hypothetical protein EAE96_007760 [Botrytis aclada]